VYKSKTLPIIQRVQRLGLLAICPTMPTTPTAALDCLYGIPPIDIYMEGLALKAMARLMRSMARLGRPRKAVGPSGPHFPCDHETDFLPARLYEVVIKSRKEWEEQGSPVSIGPVVNCFTDG
jgi:hypothetical protein